MKNIFINFTNHPSSQWDEKQTKEANRYGQILDVPFPSVSATASKEEIYILAKDCVAEIMHYEPAAVLCQGEFCLSYQVIGMLLVQGVHVVAACSDRETIEHKKEDGSVEKIARYRFVQFREY